jgi:Ca2+-dependent lipid-binding protein
MSYCVSITVVEAHDLRSADSNGLSDPYAQVWHPAAIFSA